MTGNIQDFRILTPKAALELPLHEVLSLLEQIDGGDLWAAFDPGISIPSPVAGRPDSEWLKFANTVGVNVRTIRHFWNLVPYALNLSDAQDAIHILPIWEPGVVSSLYGPCSWNINPEFYSPELAAAFPALDTVEKQLKVVVNLLHRMGKTVGMDVVPHTDRFSEQALANPQFFEWLQRRDLEILRHNASLYEDVQMLILGWLLEEGSAVAGLDIPHAPEQFFGQITEVQRLRILFGEVQDYQGRLNRRKRLLERLYDEGYETLPATMGPPYRGIEVDPNPAALVRDEDGRTWRDYRITKPQSMSRVFGPLARYRLYEPKNDNRDWELDFEQPTRAAWDYVCEHYRQIQAHYNFDFMRGDMSHVQMRPQGVPAETDDFYDLQRAVKHTVQREKPWFGFFAESFLAPPGEMAYGDECDHLEAAHADSTLGDLQSEPVGTPKFMQDFWQYRNWLETRHFAPNFTIFTADKDDPRFDGFYLRGNEIRYFIALFLTDMPSYMGLGFECRDPHPVPAPNEYYTKLYVFQMPDGPKGTSGPYQWGRNTTLYSNLVRQKRLADQIYPGIRGTKIDWLQPPLASGTQTVIAWTQAERPRYIFIANLDTLKPAEKISISVPEGTWKVLLSTARELPPPAKSGNRCIACAELLPGEGIVLCKSTESLG